MKQLLLLQHWFVSHFWSHVTHQHVPSYLILAVSLSQPVSRPCWGQHNVAMVVQSLTSHCWRRESTRTAPALRADTRRSRGSLQIVRETVGMERKGLENEKLTSGLEKQSFFEEEEWEMHPRKVAGGRKASGQQWSYWTHCYLLFKKGSISVSAQDGIKDKKQENTAWSGTSIRSHRSFSIKYNPWSYGEITSKSAVQRNPIVAEGAFSQTTLLWQNLG